jgi:hypothetical protein
MYIRRGSASSFSYSPMDLKSIPLMIGLANSGFGCHEALPSLIKPIRNKRKISQMFGATFSLVFILYILLCSMALSAFDGPIIADLFLLNFQVIQYKI